MSIPTDYTRAGNASEWKKHARAAARGARLGAREPLAASDLGICHSSSPSICQETGSKAQGAKAFSQP